MFNNVNQFYTVNDSAISCFFQLPKFLFEGKYRDILQSNDRLLYAFLKSMTTLSLQNQSHYADEHGRIFFYLNQSDLAEQTCLSLSTVGRSLRSLEDAGLIHKEQHRNDRNGNFSVCRYYLLKPHIDASSDNDDINHLSSDVENAVNTSTSTVRQNDRPPHVILTDRRTSKRETNNNNINNNNYNNLSIYNQNTTCTDDGMDEIDRIDTDMIIKLVDKKIDWDKVDAYFPRESWTNVRACMIDVLSSSQPFFKIGGTEYKAAFVKKRYLSLRTEHVLEVLNNIATKGKVQHNALGYLRTCLFNITSTLSLQLASPDQEVEGYSMSDFEKMIASN